MPVLGDVRIVWDGANFGGDVAMSAGDLLSGNDLETAVLISLFTDQVAPPNYVFTDGTTDRRGWWADTYTGDPIGSLLWTFMRSKRINSTLNDVVDCAKKALAWMVADGVAASVDVTGAWYNASALALRIVVTEPSARSQALSFIWSME